MNKRDELHRGGRLIVWMLISIPALYLALQGILAIVAQRTAAPQQGAMVIAAVLFVGWTAIALLLSVLATIGLIICATRVDEHDPQKRS